MLSKPDPSRDIQQIASLASDEYSGGEQVEEIGQKYFQECHCDWNVSRPIWEGDELVHLWGVWGYQMRLGLTR